MSKRTRKQATKDTRRELSFPAGELPTFKGVCFSCFFLGLLLWLSFSRALAYLLLAARMQDSAAAVAAADDEYKEVFNEVREKEASVELCSKAEQVASNGSCRSKSSGARQSLLIATRGSC